MVLLEPELVRLTRAVLDEDQLPDVQPLNGVEGTVALLRGS